MAYTVNDDGTTTQGPGTSPYSSGLSAFTSGITGVADLGGAFEQSVALQAQGSFQLTMAQINQQFAGRQAKQIIDLGNQEADQIAQKAKQVIGSQRSSAAAQGIAVNDNQGSIATAESDTQLLSMHDEVTARNNAWKQAWGITTQAAIGVNTAKFNASGAEFAANATLLGGGLKAAGAFAQSANYAMKAMSTKDPTVKTTSGYKTAGEPTWFYGDSPRSQYGAPASDNWWESKEDVA